MKIMMYAMVEALGLTVVVGMAGQDAPDGFDAEQMKAMQAIER